MEPLLTDLFHKGLKYWQIQYILKIDFNFSISLRHLKRLLKDLGLQRRNFSDIDTVITFIQNELNESGQLHGYRMMSQRCRENGLSVRLNDVRVILRNLDSEGVFLRTSRCLRRRAYFASGPTFIWNIDGYDKLKPFGICISGCICGFSRKMIWLNAYNTNNNPRIIGGYYLESVKQYGGCPRFVRADYGTENGHVKNFQTFFMRHLLGGERSYMDGTSSANQRIERWWSYLRRQHLHIWIEAFRELLDNGNFSGNFIDKNLIQFCFTAIIQNELDLSIRMWNNHNIRCSSNPRVPHGRPNNMYNFPTLWNKDNKITEVTDDDWRACSTEAEFRSLIPCDVDLYEVCLEIMKEHRMTPASTFREATDLYIFLRGEIMSLL